MALIYTGTNGIFTHIGKVIAIVNEVAYDLDDWDGREYDIQTVYDAGGQHVAESSLINTVDQVQSILASTRQSLTQIVDARLQDYDSVVSQLAIPGNGISQILSALIFRMNADSESVKGSTVLVGSVTAGASNVGNGTMIVDTTLDGVSNPSVSILPHPKYFGVLSEVAVDDTLTVTCQNDSYSDGVTSGQEQFGWNGTLGLPSPWSEGTEGSGQGPTLSTLQAGSLISNMNFENFSTTDTPDSWTVSAGVVGTNIKQETTGSNVYRGSSSLKIIGNSSAASITITQTLSSVVPAARYACSIRYKATAAEGAGGKTFTVQLTGTGYSAGSTEKISIDGTALATSWTLQTFFVNVPANPPSDLALTVSFTGTPTVSIYLDDIGFDRVTYHNGVCAAVIAGSTPFVRNDTFTFTTSNVEGEFQAFMRRNYGVQLPSKTDGTETIPDTLAM